MRNFNLEIYSESETPLQNSDSRSENTLELQDFGSFSDPQLDSETFQLPMPLSATQSYMTNTAPLIVVVNPPTIIETENSGRKTKVIIPSISLASMKTEQKSNVAINKTL